MHDDDEAQHGEALTPAELARAIAERLARLAHHAAQPEAAGSLPAFSAQLAAMAVDQAELARELALRDAIGAMLEQETRAAASARAEQIEADRKTLAAELGQDGAAALAGPHRPVQAGKALAEAEPLTSRAIVEAVAQLVRRTAAPLPEDASPSEQLAAARHAAAARHVARLVPLLAVLVDSLNHAVALHQQRDGEAPSLEATGAIAEGLVALVDGLRDLAEGGAGAPLAALRVMLANVETGRLPTFSRSAPQGPIRATGYREGRLMGLAACALDARMKAGARESRAAMAVAAAVRRATSRDCSPDWVREQRKRCMKAARDPEGKGFGTDHPALNAWTNYQRQIVASPARNPGDDAEGWNRVAETFEGFMTAEEG